MKEEISFYQKGKGTMQKRNRHTGWIAALCIAAVIAAAAGIYAHFGGFGTGGCADTEEFSKYAVSVSELTVPEEAQIIALGEATHGNREFQQLRLEVFQVLAEKYGVRAFALEADYAAARRSTAISTAKKAQPQRRFLPPALPSIAPKKWNA